MNNLSVTGCSEFSEFLVQQHSQFFNLLLCCHNSSLVMPSSESHFPLASAVYFHDPTWRTNIHKNRMQVKKMAWYCFFFIFWGAFFCLLIGIRQISLDFACLKMSIIFYVCIQLVQVIINTTHLEQSCHYLEEFISNITNVPPHTANATKLYGTSTFKVLLTTCISSFYSFFYIYLFHSFMHAGFLTRPFAGCSSRSRGRDLHQPECQNWPVSAASWLWLVGFGARRQYGS